MATYIWSDLHLGHTNIIKYCNRPFTSVDEMDNLILSNWRKTVKSGDIIINLGDVKMCSKWNQASLKPLIHGLPGHKILVLGNHDRSVPLNWWRDVGFDEVYPHPIIYREWYILSHEPVFLNEHLPYINIHGHTHDKSYDHPSYRNVSVEKTNYMPASFERFVVSRCPVNTPKAPIDIVDK